MKRVDTERTLKNERRRESVTVHPRVIEMNEEYQPRVSVVVPVYNGAQYLAECIESVLAQTYKNWDLTVINNCSTDSTIEISQHYADIDRRIRIYNNPEFLPVVANHNNALRQISAASKYCKLLFADDWLFPICIEMMVMLAEAHSSVGIVSAYGLRDSTVMWAGLPYPSTVVSGHDVCHQRLLGGPYVFGTGTSQMFRSDLVRSREPFYNESNLHCDSEVCFQILEQSDFGFIHQILHYTRAPSETSFTTYAHKMHTLEAMTLYELITYGPVYMIHEEFHSHLKKKLAEHYRFLAQSVLDGGKLWGFHKAKLREFGFELNKSRLAIALLGKLVNAVLKHPRRTVVQLLSGSSIISSRLHSVLLTGQKVSENYDEKRT
jgi:glycosyltransferase involved in cell wall biosynthesis